MPKTYSLSRQDIADLTKSSRRLLKLDKQVYKITTLLRSAQDVLEDLEFAIETEQDVITSVLDEVLHPVDVPQRPPVKHRKGPKVNGLRG